MIEHLIYDFDGTISDSYPLFTQFFHIVAQKQGFPLTCSDMQLYHAAKQTMKHAYDLLRCEDVCDYQTFVEEFHALQRQYKYDFQIFPEAKALLKLACRRGKHNYIYTHTGPVVKEMLEHMGVLDCFDFVLDDSYGFPAKPAPDALQFFLKTFQLEPRTCMMIGDRPIDAHAGMNAGMYGCLWDQDDLFPDVVVDFRIKELSELSELVNL